MIRRRPTGFFPGGETSAYSSTLERDFLEILRFDPNVCEFRVQHPRITFFDSAGKPHVYTPDVWVRYHSATGKSRITIYEVKARALLRLTWSELKPRLKAGIAFAKAHAWAFRLLDESRIRTPYLQNARLLTRYLDVPAEPEIIEAFLSQLADLRETDAEGLLASVMLPYWERARILPTLWLLVATGRIGADLSQPLTMRTRLWTAEGNVADRHYGTKIITR